MWGHGPVTSVVGRWKLGIRKDPKGTLGSTEEFKKSQPELQETLSKDGLEFLISPASTWRVYLMSLHIFTRHSVYALLGTEPRTLCSASMLTDCILSSALLALILSLQARRLVLHGKGPCGDWRIDTTSFLSDPFQPLPWESKTMWPVGTERGFLDPSGQLESLPSSAGGSGSLVALPGPDGS